MLIFDKIQVVKDLEPLFKSYDLGLSSMGIAIPKDAIKDPLEAIVKIFGLSQENEIQHESILIIDFIRQCNTFDDLSDIESHPPLRAIIKSTGEITLVSMSCEKNTHYVGITKIKSITEIPFFLSTQDFFEVCNCGVDKNSLH